jgi:amino acid adenylation domain-containing protein
MVEVDYASHSAHMDEVLDELASSLSSVRPRRAGRIAQCSSVSADLIAGDELDGAYWARNLRQPVRFHESLERLLSLGYDAFVEVSPHPVLVQALDQTVGVRAVATGSLRRDTDEVRELSEALARLYAVGAPIDWKRRYGEGGRAVALPSYPWQRQRFWFDAPRPRTMSDSGHGWLRRRLVVGADPTLEVHEGVLGDHDTDWLSDHKVHREAVVPAAVWLEAGAHAAREAWGAGAHGVSRIELVEPLVLAGAERRIQIAVTREGDDDASFEVLSATAGGSAWTPHARGRLQRGDGTVPSGPVDATVDASASGFDRAGFYAAMRARGLGYGPAFQIVQAIRRGNDRAVADVALPGELATQTSRYIVHPALLDGCLQTLAGVAATNRGFALPVGIESLRVHRPAASRGRALAVLTRADAGEISGDVTLVGDDGVPILEVKGLRVRRLVQDVTAERLYSIQWEVRPLAQSSGEPRSGRWLVFTDGAGDSETILTRMQAGGLACVRISHGSSYVRREENAFEMDPTRPDGYRRLLADVGGPLDGVLHLWSAEPREPIDMVEAERVSGCGAVLHLVKALAARKPFAPPRIWIATRGTQPLGPQVGVVHAALWGLVRSLGYEHPEVRPSAVDLSVASSAREIDAFVGELAADTEENQVALRDATRFVARVRRSRIEDLAAAEHLTAPRAPYRVEIPRPGLLDRIEIRSFTRRRPQSGEVEIEVAASGLNFLDVLHAMGTYPGQASQNVLVGHECAGRVVAVGPGVDTVTIGQEVVAVTAATLATHATADARLVFPRPRRLSIEQAAGIPLAYLTAQYALISIARLSAGERVLIHSASGGVGLAAIAVARRAGAEILATAGTEEKRAYLRALGIGVVLDSRTTAFAGQVMEATAGRGVDVLLNSLTGAASAKGLSVLASYGRFVELGKKDIYEGRKLALSAFRRNLSYAALDLAAVVRDQPERLRKPMEAVLAALDGGELPPLPVEAWPLARVEDAFRKLRAAQHVGKLVVVPGDPAPSVLPERGRTLRPDATYLVTGGFGGLGLAVAQWLVDRGATRVVLAGRHVPTRSTQVDAIARAGADVEAVQCDVTDAAALARVVKTLAADAGRPLRGIVHAAGVLDDGVIAHQDWRRFEAVMAPKLRGAWNLHVATENVSLDFFVLFSSAASLLGSPAQVSYAAANAFLDALAHHRRGRGLPALSIQWGAWGEVGLAAAKADRGERLAQLGMGSLHPDDALAALGALLDAHAVEAGVLELDAPLWRRAFATGVSTPYFSHLTGDATEPPDDHRDEVAPRETAYASLRAQVARTFRIPVERIGDGVSLRDLGCDSLSALELKNRLASALGVTISPVTILRAASIAELAQAVDAALGETPLKGDRAPQPLAEWIASDPASRYDPFPLTDIQQAYWIGRGASIALGSVGCHVYVEFEQVGLDPDRLERAWQCVIARHDMLRAVVLADGRQRILPDVPAYRMAVETRAIEAVREEMAHQVFSPDRWPLFDVRISRIDAERIRIHFSLDLIAADPSTLFRILADWGAYYRDLDLKPAAPGLSFRDYVLGALRFRESDEYRGSKAYWDARVDTLPGPPELPLTKDPAAVVSPRFRTREGRLEPSLWKRLGERAALHGVTPSAVLLAAFAELLDTFSSSPHFTINLTLFSRLPLHPDVHEIVGDFTSTVLLEVNAHAGDFIDRARRLHRQLLQDLDHAHVSGVEVLREMARRQKRITLMGVVFTSMLGHRDLSSFDWLGQRVVKLTQTPQVFFDHQVLEDRGALVYNWDTIEELYPDGLLDAMFEAYGALLVRLATDAAWHERAPIRLPEAQLARRRAALRTLTAPTEMLLHQPFEMHATARPDAPAVISSRRRITYGELDRHSNRVAHWLRRRGVQPNTLVGVVMEKGWEQVVAALGVLKAGAAYLPVDAGLPAERVRYLLEQGEVKVALTQSFLRPEWSWPEGVLIRALDDEDAWRGEEDTRLESGCGPDDLAYVLYTSGSTGRPKGVAMPHRGPVNTIADINVRFGITSADRVLALSSLSFDLSVYDVFGLLGAGGAIVLPDAGCSRDPAAWLAQIRGQRVTVWNSVPALMQMLVEHAGGRADAAGRSLRVAMLSGDWIPVDLPDRVKALFEGVSVWSLGGPTEASIWQVSYPIDRVDPTWTSIPYGTPLSNHDVHVLDHRLRPRPEWVPGEIYIGGRGLACGYWRDDARTGEAFVAHPQTGERLYKSGDVGRWLPAGYIEFLGRNDHQVKIQGNRIELGEIEAALKTHPEIADAVVVARGEAGRNRSLVAFVVPRTGAEGNGADRIGAELSNEADRIAFKLAGHNVRHDGSDAPRIPLDHAMDPVAARALYAERSSRRRFARTPLPVGSLSQLLRALTPIAMDGEPLGKHRYPSAGHLYPVQTYVYVEPGRVSGLDGGVYYHDPREHVLVLLSPHARIDPSVHVPHNHRLAEDSTFSLFFIAQMRAIEPLYGALSRDFCLIEVGTMAQLLMTAAPPLGLGLCEIGALDFDRIAPFFRLDAGHQFLHGMVGGAVAEGEATPAPEPRRHLASDLSQHLSRLLPAYMLPAAIVRLDRIPLTQNGKVDRTALPDPGDAVAGAQDAAPPKTDLERRLADIVAEELHADRVSVRTNLFDLGFTSVQVVSLARRLQQELQRDISVVDLFRLPTIEAFAEFLSRPPADATAVAASERADTRRVLMRNRRTGPSDGASA